MNEDWVYSQNTILSFFWAGKARETEFCCTTSGKQNAQKS